MKRGYLFAAFAFFLALDQLTKQWVVRAFRYGERHIVDPRFLDLTLVHNKGAAFGLGNNWPDWLRLIAFYLVSLAAVAAILYCLFKLDWRREKSSALGLAFILSGAVGNLIDRLRLGYVIDFIYMHWHQHYWPAYNVADAAICIGAGLLAISALGKKEKK